LIQIGSIWFTPCNLLNVNGRFSLNTSKNTHSQARKPQKSPENLKSRIARRNFFHAVGPTA
jgi:hypothetical protein